MARPKKPRAGGEGEGEASREPPAPSTGPESATSGPASADEVPTAETQVPSAAAGRPGRLPEPADPPLAGGAVAFAPPSSDELAQTREGEGVARALLMDAGQALIAEQGFTAVTVESISRAAQLTPDVFHAHFGGKEALLRALGDRFAEQMNTATDASTRSGIWKGALVADVVEIAVRTVLDVVHERRGLVRAFLSEGARDPVLVEGLRRIGAHLTSRLGAVIAECRDADAYPDRDRLLGFSLFVSAAMVHQVILVGESWSGIPFTREQLTDETTKAVAAYLASRRKA